MDNNKFQNKNSGHKERGQEGEEKQVFQINNNGYLENLW